MRTPACRERLTAAAAATFVLSVGVVTTLPSARSLPLFVLALSAISFVSLYVSG